MFNECDAYKTFCEGRPALHLAELPVSGQVWLMTLEGRWIPCDATRYGGIFNVTLAVKGPLAAYARGTSGSPIVSADGGAVALVSVGDMLNPLLIDSLPRRVGLVRRKARARR